MKVLSSETITLKTSEDIVQVRKFVRKKLVEHGFKLLDQTKMVTATSELARNTLIYGQGGEVKIEILAHENKRGVHLVFTDRGPGIPDLERALQNGYSTGSGLGLGLGGSKRLVDEFSIQSKVGQGTCVSVKKWRVEI